MSEPDYIAQVEQKPEHHRAWWRERAIDAAAIGCTFSRASYMQDRWRHFAMFEAWKVRPEDQGEPRWSMSERAELQPMDTLPALDSDGIACNYTRAPIHRGSIIILEGTNGKDAAWIDAREAFGHRIYRHHILEA